jgi:predicted Zn-dependent protease
VPGIGQARVRLECLQAAHGHVIVAAIASVDGDPDYETQLSAALASVRQLSASEAARVVPGRVEIETAADGDTWDRVARRHGGVVMGGLLAILNHADPGRPIEAGTRIKVVVAGRQ